MLKIKPLPLTRFFLALICASILLLPLFTAGDVLADPSLTINSPGAGSTIGPGRFEISVSFSMGVSKRWVVYAHWADSALGGGGQSFQQEVTGSSGTVTFQADASGYPASRYRVGADIVSADSLPAATILAHAQNDFSIGAGAAVNPSTGTTTPGGGSSGGLIAGILAGAAAVIGGGIWLLSKMRKTPNPVPARPSPTPKATYREAETVEQAAARLAAVKRNGLLLDRYNKLRQIVWSDDRMLDYVDGARNSIIGKDSIVDEAKLLRMENTLKFWIQRDQLTMQLPDYTGGDVMLDTVRQASGNIFIRVGAAYLSAGYSEMALNPISAVSNMGQNILDGDSAAWAVTKGVGQSGFELALGESGRVIKPLVNYGKEAYNSYKLGQLSSELKSEISTVTQLAGQTEEQMTRNAFMRATETAKGESTLYKFTSAEQEALRLNNNPEFRELMAKNSDLLPNEFKEVLGVAKQKAYQQARNNAVNDVMEQMAKDGVNTGENPYFIRQTGTHAQPGNPGWNSAKSDFDHTVEFGDPKYNQLYEQKFNAHLESQGTSAQAMDANIYGEGTSSRGAYTGGAKKFVEHYNETTGSDVMVRNVNGATHINTETPQTSTSLMSRMNGQDVQSASQNYRTFFEKDVAKAGGDLKSQIVNGSKTVSREAGSHGVQSVKHFQETGTMGYEPPPAAKVADLIKERGMSIPDAMKKVGYRGSQQDLFNDFKTIMGK